ncbi:hypothetical protein BD410DRAFT_902674 [Rickenella mellea]|uniref:Uncharacterized protein n=1 Tax=Rickenella mellea TaxID=50990 RepID=A0A4Y7PKA2_9AGAM|nr:hypothetical protein BD410DRAFT_902674 [Rickenella mellea]
MSTETTEARSSEARHCDRVAPILQIPREVTSEIFQHGLPEDEYPKPSVKSAPVQLTRVCSAWRKVAIWTPRLWSKVSLCTRNSHFTDANGYFISNMESHVEVLRVWMERATPLPLSVHLRYTPLPWLDESAMRIEALLPVFRVMVENAARWKDLRLGMPRNYLSCALRLIQRNATNLETLNIEDPSIPEFGRLLGYKYHVHLDGDVAETLSTLSVRAPVRYTSRNPAPFVRLRTLSLQHTLPENCLHLLKYCAVLEDLSLHFCEWRGSSMPLPTSTILLPQLRNFHLSHTGYGEYGCPSNAVGPLNEIGELLDSFRSPELRGFYLLETVVGMGPVRQWAYLSRLITRSNCSLNELELNTTHIEPSSVLKCLQLSPDLKYLCIPSDNALREDDVRPLLPSLQSLRVFK